MSAATDIKADFLPIRLSTLTPDEVNAFDLYVENAGVFQLYRHQSVPLTFEDIANLREREQCSLYVHQSQKEEMHAHMIKKLPVFLQDGSITTDAKLELLTETSVSIFERVFSNPSSKEGLANSVKQCKNHTALALLAGSNEKIISSGRPDTTSPVAHAINVGNLSILLGLRCGITDPTDLHCLATGAILHEVGKRIIDPNYYSRPESGYKITDARLKSYPFVGSNLLQESEVVPVGALKPVLEHQERLDGTGYPKCLTAPEISREGRIVAICDYYDECLYNRSPRSRTTPYQVLLKMTGRGTQFDRRILVEFIRLLGSDLG